MTKRGGANCSVLFYNEVIEIKKPNSTCKNSTCRKHFYACGYCTRTNSWRAIACSPECYTAYMNEVSIARARGVIVNLHPERTDMTDAELHQLMKQPIEEVVENTKEELAEYADELDEIGFGGVVEKINSEIDKGTDKHTKHSKHKPKRRQED